MKRIIFILFLTIASTMFCEIIIKGNAQDYIQKDRAEYHLNRICKSLNVSPKSIGNITIVGTDTEISGFSFEGVPDWGIALAIPSKNTIVIRKVNYALDHVLAHEIAHIVLHNSTRTQLPRWFDEGVAEYFSRNISYNDMVKMSWLNIIGAPKFDDFEKIYKSERIIAENLYGLSFQAVYFLVKEYKPATIADNENILAIITGEIKRQKNFEAGFFSATGVSPYEFEYEFRRFFQGRFGISAAIFSTTTLWYGILILFIVAGVVSWIRKKQSLKDITETDEIFATDKDIWTQKDQDN